MDHEAPILAAHADWSVNPAKRVITHALRQAGRQTGRQAGRHAGRWMVDAPEPVGPPGDLLARLLRRAAGAPVAFGVDFPLGLPRAYAARAGITDFPTWLRGLPPDAPLFRVCDRLDELSLARPFYPRASVTGAGHQAALAHALGLAGPQDLRRAADHPTARRPGGAPLFWTLGANQCGKAALSGWRDCLLPAFAAQTKLRLWPFEGEFRALLQPAQIVIAETYPAEALVQLGLTLRGSKRNQADRQALAPDLLRSLAQLQAEPSPALHHAISSGFGPSPTGEDQFDSLLGVLNVIAVINGAPDRPPDHSPPSSLSDPVEGWVLGQIDWPIQRRHPPTPASTKQHPSRPPRATRRSPRADPPKAGSD
ncbi:hypothetical protein [Acidiphilium sp. MT5]